MILEPIKLAWWFVSHALFVGAGAHKADQMHLDLIDAVLAELSTDIADIVTKQLAQRYFISWMSDGRINVFFFYDEESLPLIPDPDFEDRLFKVEIFVDGRKHRAQVSFYKRRIHCVEIKKPRSFFKGKNFSIGMVTPGKPSGSFTGAIDRAEHGKETETNP